MLTRSPRRVPRNDLNLTSMMDMFTIILTFLLSTLATSDVSVTPSAELSLPFSSADAPIELAVNLVLTRGELLVDGVRVLDLVAVPDERSPGRTRYELPSSAREGGRIAPLWEVLETKAAGARKLAEQTGRPDHAFKGRLLLQCDREMPYSLIRDLMLTAGQAGFGEFQFVVYRRE